MEGHCVASVAWGCPLPRFVAGSSVFVDPGCRAPGCSIKALPPFCGEILFLLFHVSLEADDPRHVAHVFAEIFGGEAAPFPPIGDDSWVALAGDDRGTIIEVYPRGTEMHLAPGDADAVGVIGPMRRNNATHIAIATPFEMDDIFAIAEREQWPVKYSGNILGGRDADTSSRGEGELVWSAPHSTALSGGQGDLLQPKMITL